MLGQLYIELKGIQGQINLRRTCRMRKIKIRIKGTIRIRRR